MRGSKSRASFSVPVSEKFRDEVFRGSQTRTIAAFPSPKGQGSKAPPQGILNSQLSGRKCVRSNRASPWGRPPLVGKNSSIVKHHLEDRPPIVQSAQFRGQYTYCHKALPEKGKDQGLFAGCSGRSSKAFTASVVAIQKERLSPRREDRKVITRYFKC